MIDDKLLHSIEGFLTAHRRYLVTGHKEPDGDCVSSQIAMARLVAALGREPVLLSSGPFDRPEIESFAERFASSTPVGADSAAIIVDCSTPDRTGSLGALIKGLPAMVIDHHSSGEVFGDVRYVDPEAPSTTLLAFSLFEAIGVKADRETVALILFGFCTDTGFFRHLGPGHAETFRTLARLAELGASTAEIFTMVYGRRTLANRKLLAKMLERTESYREDAMLVSWQTVADRADLPAAIRGEEDLYRLLQTVKANRVVAFLKEEEPGRWSVGLRSAAGLDVGAVAAGFGGGGHRQAAGFDIQGTLGSVRAAVIAATEPLL